MLAASTALIVPASALAQSSTCQAYNPQLCEVGAGTQTAASPAGASNRSQTSSSALPFTGLDLLLLAAGGAILLVVGLAARRLTRPLGEGPEPPH